MHSLKTNNSLLKFNHCKVIFLKFVGLSDKAFLLGDIEGSRNRGSRARIFAILGILLSAAVAVTVYLFWTKAYEKTTDT